jgi:predicted nucleic acid-binding protein
MGTGYYHGQWFCEVCWAAWRHGHEGRHDEQQSNGNNDSLEKLVSDTVQPLLEMLRISWHRMNEIALRQEEMQKTLTQIRR